jgi:hypothetical protein
MSEQKLPLIKRIFSDNQYDWMMRKFPFRLMYVRRWIDTQHQMWFPRWGYSKRQIENAEKRADEMFKNIKWD